MKKQPNKNISEKYKKGANSKRQVAESPLPRDNTVKRIGRAENMEDKLGVALGKAITVKTLSSDLDAAAIVERARWVVSAIISNEAKAYHLAKIGAALVSAIIQNDHPAIQKLAAEVQFHSQKNVRRDHENPRKGLHALILTFCYCHDCGTKDNPAPAKALLEYLKNFRRRFSSYHENQIPRSLVKTCEKIGVWLVNR